MGPYRADPCSKPSEIDGFLAGAGYRVRSSDLCHVAQQLERLESSASSMVGVLRDDNNSSSNIYRHCSDAVHYNPSDLATWVDSMLSDITPPLPPSNFNGSEEFSWQNNVVFAPPPPPLLPLCPQPTYLEEDSGIQLVHLLMTCAESVHHGDVAMAGALVDEMRTVLSIVGTGFGIGKVATYFIDALTRRLYCTGTPTASPSESEILYHHFYEACPYLKFAHFTANQAILEALDGHDRVHVIDFNLMHGLQWPALIQALALRPGGPPFLRLTGIGPPSTDGRDSLREIGMRLAELAGSVGVHFAFRGVAANRLDDIRPWMLHVAGPPEAVAVNSVMQLHRLLGDEDDDVCINSVLDWIQGMKPKIVTLIEQEADHNKIGFLDRFTEALFYYSTMFDSIDGGTGGGCWGGREQSVLAEVYLQREICNILCCEGATRTERHEPLAKWRSRMSHAGFKATHLGSNAFKQASMLLTLFSGEGYCVEELDGCLTLGWHSRPLISASAWRADDDVDAQVAAEMVVAINSAGVLNGNSSHDNSNSMIITDNNGPGPGGDGGGSTSSSSNGSGGISVSDTERRFTDIWAVGISH